MRGTVRWLAAALLIATARAGAQGAQDGYAVRVDVVEADGGAPVGGAIVSLVDVAGAVANAALTDAAGRALLAAPGAGPFRVRAERVGFERRVGEPITLVAGETRRVRVEMPARRTQLAGVVVRGRQQCVARPAEGARTAALWDEVRKALTATVLSAGTRSSEMTIRGYARLVTTTGRVDIESTTVRTAPLGSPVRSAPAELLSAKGFIQEIGDGTYYFAPDAALLVSERFVADHCFRVERRGAGDSAMVGLAFEPGPGRRVSDIRGTLWLDEKSAELRFVEYRYTRLPDEVRGDAQLGGRVSFARLDDGRWIVARWQIRTPRVRYVRDQLVGGVRIARHYELLGYREEGGAVSVASAADDPAGRPAVVAGFVFDSTRGRALSGARVALVGTEVADTTDALGHYRLEAARAGRYVLAVSHARLALAGELREEVALDAGGAARVDVAFPSLVTLRRARCGDESEEVRRATVLVAGVARDSATGRPLTGARVTVSWRRAVLAERGKMAVAGMATREVEVESDSAGIFAACGVPAGATIRVRASDAVRAGALTPIALGEEQLFADASLALAPSAGGASARGAGRVGQARIAGVVTSSETGKPLEGAEVSVAGLARVARTDRAGRFDLSDVPVGAREVMVRRVGMAPERDTVTLADGDSLALAVALSRTSTRLANVAVRATREPSGAMAEFERHRLERKGGTFIDQALLERRESSSLSDVLRSQGSSLKFIRRFPEGGLAIASTRGGAGLRQGSTGSTAPCLMQIYLDGRKLWGPGTGGGVPNIDEFIVSELGAVEVYYGPAATPPEYSGTDAACGTVVIWSRKK